MIDPELEAIQKCTELLKELDDEAKIRVLQYLVNRYKLTATHQTYFNPTSGADNGHTNKSDEQPQQNRVAMMLNEPAKQTVGKYPTLRDIVAKDLPKSEPEWVLLYCFYASNFGENDFSKGDIVSNYEQSKRISVQKKRNLTLNVNSALRQDWIKSINDTQYIMLDAGKQYASDIINGKSATKPRKVIKRAKKEQQPTNA